MPKNTNPSRPDPIATLTGQLSSLSRPKAITERGGGGKFDTKGRVMSWPGNTFICPIDQASGAHEALVRLQTLIKESEFGYLFTFLPPSSFHMTVFEGWAPFLENQVCWPNDPDLDGSRTAATAKLQNSVRDLVVPGKFRIKPVELYALHSVTVQGADEWQEASLRDTREVLRDVTGIQPEDFTGYVFHITLAYQLQWVDTDLAKEIVSLSKELGDELCRDTPEIELGPCELCNFESMQGYNKVMVLGSDDPNESIVCRVRVALITAKLDEWSLPHNFWCSRYFGSF